MPRFSIQAAIPVLLFLGIGCMCIYFGITQAIRSHERQSWPQVDAVVLESDAIFLGGDGEGGGEAEIKILLEYKVQQNTYQALIYAKDVSKADYIPPQYAVGKTVMVHYDPTDPSSPIYHFPSVVSSIVVALIGLIPLLPALLLVVFWIAKGFVHWKMFQARRYLRLGVQESAQFNQLLEQMKAEGRTVSSELLAKKSQLARKVEEAYALLTSLQEGIEELTPPLEEECEEEKHSTRVVARKIIQPKATFLQRLVTTVALIGIPLLIGLAMTWWAPYYLMTCQRNADNSVDCELQQMLFGFLRYGKPETIAGLREIDYKMEGEIRKQRALMRLTGTSTKQIYAGRAAFTSKSIKQFLLNTNMHGLRVSDGHTMLSLYFPYVLVMLSLAAMTIGNKEAFSDQLVSFMIGSLLASTIALLPFLYLCDIHNTSLTTWSVLASAIIAGGIIKVTRQMKT